MTQEMSGCDHLEKNGEGRGSSIDVNHGACSCVVQRALKRDLRKIGLETRGKPEECF